MSRLGNWPIVTCTVDDDGATAAGVDDDPPQDTAPMPPEPEHADASSRMTASERQGVGRATSVFINVFSLSPRAHQVERREGQHLRRAHEVVDSARLIR